jgi:citrate lyase beta subunit
MKAVPPAVGDVVARGVTFLFVPGDRPERFAKAADAGADVVIIDLEDAVALGGYAIALANTVAALRETDLRALVRIHPSSSPDHASQVAHLSAMDISGLLGVMMAKAESRDEVESVRAAFAEEFAVIPLVESAAGLLASLEMASVPGVTRLAFGAVDFALDIGSGSAPEYLAYARSHLVVASRGAGVAPPLDSPSQQQHDCRETTDSAENCRSTRHNWPPLLMGSRRPLRSSNGPSG